MTSGNHPLHAVFEQSRRHRRSLFASIWLLIGGLALLLIVVDFLILAAR